MSLKVIMYLLFLANTLLFLFGWMLSICGAVILNKPEMSNCGFVQGTSIYMIIIGCITILVSLFGCLGALQKNVCLLLMYTGFLFLVFLLLIICLIIAFSLREKVGEYILDDMKRDINSTKSLEYIDNMQKALKCCGIDSWQDWRFNPSYAKVANLPLSCCEGINSFCTNSQTGFLNQTCAGPYMRETKENLKVMGAVATSSAIFVLIVIILTLIMIHLIRAEYNVVT